jgi:hypothetical protein
VSADPGARQPGVANIARSAAVDRPAGNARDSQAFQSWTTPGPWPGLYGPGFDDLPTAGPPAGGGSFLGAIQGDSEPTGPPAGARPPDPEWPGWKDDLDAWIDQGARARYPTTVRPRSIGALKRSGDRATVSLPRPVWRPLAWAAVAFVVELAAALAVLSCLAGQPID